MTPPGSDDEQTAGRGLPEPPYPAELLADLHTDRLDPGTTAHIRTRIAHDSDALATLEAFEKTDADLRRHAADTDLPIPDSVALGLHETLAQIAHEAGSQISGTAGHAHRPTPWSAQRGRTAPGAGRGIRLSVRHILGAGIGIVALIAVVAFSTTALGSGGEGPDQRATGPSDPDTAVSPAAMMSVLGESSGAPFPSVDALRRCTAANGVPTETVVVGSGEISIDSTARAVILLSTGVAGQFDALVVETHCNTGDPATVSRTTIGVGAG